MTIPTQMSLHGYIATAPELSFTDRGHARFYCRVGIEQYRKYRKPELAQMIYKVATEQAAEQAARDGEKDVDAVHGRLATAVVQNAPAARIDGTS